MQTACFPHANLDCNHNVIVTEYVDFWRQLLEADGVVSAEEAAALQVLSDRLRAVSPSALTQQWAKARVQAGLVSGQVKGALKDGANWTKNRFPASAVPAVDLPAAASQIHRAASTAGRRAEESVARLAGLAKERINKLKSR